MMMRKCTKTGFYGDCGRFDLTTQVQITVDRIYRALLIEKCQDNILGIELWIR